jgi:hypothetical protein
LPPERYKRYRSGTGAVHEVIIDQDALKKKSLNHLVGATRLIFSNSWGMSVYFLEKGQCKKAFCHLKMGYCTFFWIFYYILGLNHTQMSAFFSEMNTKRVANYSFFHAERTGMLSFAR